ncbi:MAG TPA: hypothetical protein VJ505_05665 [Holophagaceae bacterium]|nr:hypothetical protein [Holophagaceae bacterium]
MLAQTEKAPAFYVWFSLFNRTPINLCVFAAFGWAIWSEGLKGILAIQLSNLEALVLLVFGGLGIWANVRIWREYFNIHFLLTNHRLIHTDTKEATTIYFEDLHSYKIKPRIFGTDITLRLSDGQRFVVERTMYVSATKLIEAIKRIKVSQQHD